MRIPFFHDDESDSVVAEFTLDESFSGAPSYVHGGVTLAVLDEAQAWATIAVCGKFAVTVETTTRFHRPVHVGRTFTVEATVTGQPEGQIAPPRRGPKPPGQGLRRDHSGVHGPVGGHCGRRHRC